MTMKLRRYVTATKTHDPSNEIEKGNDEFGVNSCTPVSLCLLIEIQLVAITFSSHQSNFYLKVCVNREFKMDI
jgi:hypothetical protein